jgi:2'-5' RNA ligase
MARLRTFIAVDLGTAIRDRCVALQETLACTGTAVKWVEPENLHVTILFLGEVDERTVPDVCRAVAVCCGRHEGFTLGVEKLGCFGNPRRPRTVWVGVGEGHDALIALHDALEAALMELGCYRREDRPYTPHITLGRVQGERTTNSLAAELVKRADWKAGETPVREVLVMSSELTPKGPIYTVLGRGKLRNPWKQRKGAEVEDE